MLRSSISPVLPAVSSALRGVAQRAMSAVVPVIDIGPLVRDEEGKHDVAKQIAKACEEIGFLAVQGHGFPEDVLQRCWTETRSYFDLAEEKKMEVPMTEEYPYGYSCFGGEVLSKGLGDESPPDLKELWSIGPFDGAAAGVPETQWPEDLPAFKEAQCDYFRAMEVLAAHMLRGFAIALDLPERWFEPRVTHHASALRALNYPELPSTTVLDGQQRAGAHTDYGALTILKQDGVGGLQVMSRSGEWADAVTPEDAFVINLGDLMARWTNDKWVSTLHRVVPTTTERRQSIAFFHNVNNDELIQCIDSCKGDAGAKYAPIKAGEHLMEKHLASTT